MGGMAAVFQGAPVDNFDLDVVHLRSETNILRLLAALAELDAYYRSQPERRFRPDESHLRSAGHQLLTTRFGPFDVLGAIGNGRSYEDLLPHAPEIELNTGIKIRVLDLETIIALKEELGGEKDLAVLPTLRRTLEESQRRKSDLR